MARFLNGLIPLSVLVYLGGEHYLAPGTNARWQWMVAAALAKYGVVLRISSGANGYRWLDKQKEAFRNEPAGNAAYPGTSSHGGIWGGRECMAIDVANWQDLAPGNRDLAWARFVALCRLAGFTTGLFSWEPWHIVDFNDIWTIPENLVAATAETAPTPLQEEDDMLIIRITVFDGSVHICQLGNGLFASLVPEDREDILRDINRQPREYDFSITSLPSLLRTHGCDPNIWDVRDGKLVVLDPLTGEVGTGKTWTAQNAMRGALAGIKLPTVDLAPIVAAVVKAIKDNPVNDVNEEEIAKAVVAILPKNPTAEQIAKAVSDEASKRLAS